MTDNETILEQGTPAAGSENETKKDNKLEKKVKESFIEEDERLLSILGTNTAKAFFSTGVLGNGFAVLSDKRMYFKGRCYLRSGNHFVKKMEERVVDLSDITGTGFVHRKSIVTTVLYWIVTIPWLLGVPGIFWLIYLITKQKWAHTIAHIVNPFSGLLYLIDKSCNYSLFEVSYAGGGIGFDLAWITKEDSDAFQKALQAAKTAFKKAAQTHPGKETTSPIIMTSSVPEQLKQYKELLDSGILSQEEFDAKKKELLHL